MKDRNQIGTPVDQFVKEGNQRHIAEQVSNHINAANDMIKHARENYGAKIELSVRPDGSAFDAMIAFDGKDVGGE